MGTTTAGLCSKKWAGVMAVASAASSLDLFRGRELSIDSTSQKTVRSTCSVTKTPFKIAFNARFVSLISLSHTPEKCGAFGGWNIQSIPR
jgi:hypothetical protein